MLTYYAQGVGLAEFRTMLSTLGTMAGGEATMAGWVAPHPALQHINLKNLCLEDARLLHSLHTTLHRDMVVVNHWLNHHVFRHFAKQFPTKISASAWHLASTGCDAAEPTRWPVVGFSGTNQSHPLPMVQADLSSMWDTNDRMDAVIAATEEAGLVQLTRAAPLAETVAGLGVDVVLDVGAIVKEDNATFAQAWLAARRRVCAMAGTALPAAVLYFEEDALVAFEASSGRASDYYCSPYHAPARMADCLTYLDDYHTRGTDLKFAPGAVAAVTLCAGLVRDVLAQGMMRMRQLMKGGHSARYLVPHDVQLTENVLRWVNGNTRATLTRFLVHYTQQGLYSITNAAEPDRLALTDMYSAPARREALDTYQARLIDTCPHTNERHGPEVVKWITGNTKAFGHVCCDGGRPTKTRSRSGSWRRSSRRRRSATCPRDGSRGCPRC